MDILIKYSIREEDLKDLEVFCEVTSDLFDTEKLNILTENHLHKIIKNYSFLIEQVTLRKPDLSIYKGTKRLFAVIRFGRQKLIVLFKSEKAMLEMYTMLITNCWNLTKISLEDLLDIDLENLVKSNKGLKSFLWPLRFPAIFDRCKILPASLEELSICLNHLRKEDVSSLMQKHGALKNFRLEHNSIADTLSLNDIIEILSKSARQFESLHLSDSNCHELSVSSFKLLSNFNRLKKLHIGRQFTVTKEMVTILRNFECMKDLSLQLWFISTEMITEIMKFPKLNTLSLAIMEDEKFADISEKKSMNKHLELKEQICEIINLATSRGQEVLIQNSFGSSKIKIFRFDSNSVNERNRNVKPSIKLITNSLIVDSLKLYLESTDLPGVKCVVENNNIKNTIDFGHVKKMLKRA